MTMYKVEIYFITCSDSLLLLVIHGSCKDLVCMYGVFLFQFFVNTWTRMDGI